VLSYARWFLILFVLGETYQRLGSRGLILVLVLSGIVWLLWKSRKAF
jgi:hypothetical protein